MMVLPVENSLKYQAINCHASQMGAKYYLEAFVKSDEFFWVTDFSNIAYLANVTASSQCYPELASNVADGIADGYPRYNNREWVSYWQVAGAWIQLDWDREYTIDHINLYDRVNLTNNILAATLTFSDGSVIAVDALPNNGWVKEISFKPKTVSWMRLTVTEVSPGTQSVGLSEIEVFTAPEIGLSISKKLDGYPSDWGVDNNTIFKARVKDVTNGNYIRFYEDDGMWYADGDSGSDTPGDDTRELVTFSVAEPAALTNLRANTEYKVEEAGGANYTTSYSSESLTFPEGGGVRVTVTNTYKCGEGIILRVKNVSFNEDEIVFTVETAGLSQTKAALIISVYENIDETMKLKDCYIEDVTLGEPIPQITLDYIEADDVIKVMLWQGIGSMNSLVEPCIVKPFP